MTAGDGDIQLDPHPQPLRERSLSISSDETVLDLAREEVQLAAPQPRRAVSCVPAQWEWDDASSSVYSESEFGGDEGDDEGEFRLVWGEEEDESVYVGEPKNGLAREEVGTEEDGAAKDSVWDEVGTEEDGAAKDSVWDEWGYMTPYYLAVSTGGDGIEEEKEVEEEKQEALEVLWGVIDGLLGPGETRLGEYDIEGAVEAQATIEVGANDVDEAFGGGIAGVGVKWNDETRRASGRGVVGMEALRERCAAKQEMGWWRDFRQGLVMS